MALTLELRVQSQFHCLRVIGNYDNDNDEVLKLSEGRVSRR